jgi:hypothetical protein
MSSGLASRAWRVGSALVPEVPLPWTVSRNRQKVLGFAAMAVSLVLISAPFLLNVDSDEAKAETVSAESSANAVAGIPELATAEDVIVALNAIRAKAQTIPIAVDPLLQMGSQAWASNVADSGSVRTDRSLRSLLDDRSTIGEFVVSAPNLPLAYERLMGISTQRSQLTAATTHSLGVGVHRTGNKTYLVLRFATL